MKYIVRSHVPSDTADDGGLVDIFNVISRFPADVSASYGVGYYLHKRFVGLSSILVGFENRGWSTSHSVKRIYLLLFRLRPIAFL